ncbi:unnamed protein product, partial [Polarella glacialis]
ATQLRQDHKLELAMSAPQRNLATVLRALETEEHVAASHERRGVEFAEQLAAKHHEVLMLKESLQAKGAKLDRQAEASSAEALRRCIAIEEAASDVDRRLQRSEATNRELASELASQQERRCESAAADAR